MNNKEKYLKIINILKSNSPVFTNKKRITDDIMSRIIESSEISTLQEKLVDYFFGWVNIYWLRGTMAVAAVIFTGFFIIQQLIISNRLDKLQNQSIRMENIINGREPVLGMNQRILINTFMENQRKEDSITISTYDLEELVNNYWELLRNHENYKQESGLNLYKQRRIRMRLEQSVNDDEL
ncbi:hypothetical protein ACFLR8_04840 [Bacteroidota bacterium]